MIYSWTQRNLSWEGNRPFATPLVVCANMACFGFPISARRLTVGLERLVARLRSRLSATRAALEKRTHAGEL